MLIIKNASELVTCRAAAGAPARGADFSNSSIIKNGAVVIDGETIVAIGKNSAVLARRRLSARDRVIDVSGKIVIPGFIDCHTHTVFGGSRANEYRLKLKGLSYQDLHKRKGGIHLTVEATRRASAEELFSRAKKTLDEMFARGTTTVEIKSGYGLNFKDEVKILRVIRRLRTCARQDIVATFLGAHTMPLEFKEDRGRYVREITEKMLPYIQKEQLADYCDVFCDPLGFTPKETSEIFKTAKNLGLGLRVHGEQTAHYGGAGIGIAYGVSSVDHCDFVSGSDIKLMGKKRISAVLLPGTLLHLMEWPKLALLSKSVPEMKKAGVPIVLATDYNPGSSPLISMKTVMDLALRFARLDYGECLIASTINAARALDRANRVGSLEKGKQADLLIIDAPTLGDYLHAFGDRHIEHIVKKGKVHNPV